MAFYFSLFCYATTILSVLTTVGSGVGAIRVPLNGRRAPRRGVSRLLAIKVVLVVVSTVASYLLVALTRLKYCLVLAPSSSNGSCSDNSSDSDFLKAKGSRCKHKTKPEGATIASMITMEDIQNSEHHLCGFLDPLWVHVQHKGTLPGKNSQRCGTS
jgi:hypothetical protein